MLSFHILDVGKGDSIVVEYKSDGASHFGVVDSHWRDGERPPALRKLQALGAERLSFIVLTHPHLDHFLGLDEIAAYYSGRIDKVITFPLGGNTNRLRSMVHKYGSIAKGTANKKIIRTCESLINFFRIVKNHKEWEDPTGSINRFAINGFSPDVKISSILPPSRSKGKWFQSLDEGTFEPLDNNVNDVSVALLFSFRGTQVILGGDGTETNWMYQDRQLKANEESYNSSIVKLPHHGSRHDCSELVLDSIFDKDSGERIAIISADGRSHPHEHVLSWLKDRNIKPYCTGLSRKCGGANVHTLHNDPCIDRRLQQFVNSVATPSTSSCQGDIEIRIDNNGKSQIFRQHQAPCAYRGDYESLGKL